ncbi:phosphoprotein [Actinidia cytorhabdovirus JS27]|uniref:Phosphoprotein n=1 Tax=Actinidia virus D TaxID=3069721 RepID=A0A8E6YL34_9RHAB|nr:phosphoprotein [Actinidia cytorhabdovirus JS27]QVU21444.1 phosphoprotein [Actinidia virus D]
MESESDFGDLNFKLDPGSTVLPDHDVDTSDDFNMADYNVVPNDDVVDDEDIDDDNLENYQEFKSAAARISNEYGIVLTEEMMNYLTVQSVTLSADDNALRWFFSAISFGNNRKIIPNLESITEDLRAEIKNLQTTSKAVSNASSDIIKKMVSVKDEIFSGFESLRRNVIDKLVLIPKEVEEVVKSKSTEVDPPKSSRIPLVSKEESKTKWVPKANKSKPEAVKAEEVTPPIDAEEKLRQIQLKIIIKMGAMQQWIKKLPAPVINKILPPAEASVLMTSWADPSSDEIKEDVMGRIDLLEEELFS